MLRPSHPGHSDQREMGTYSTEVREEEVEETAVPAWSAQVEQGKEHDAAEKEQYPQKRSRVKLEGYVDGGEADGEGQGPDDAAWTRSLTEGDLEELKGCLDLGFGFSYEEIPGLCNTLPALELCYSMSRGFFSDRRQLHQRPLADAAIDPCASPPSPPVANWKISSPGDHPDEVKARLKYWARAVACTIKLCN
ncbi:hypothetical protein ZIOFF_023859 [Zingiber officinale]|uniref:Uncharacterized protein n=2 Tax=Zingiber officinale TaxID=94328 RepID=A0A8J5LIR3_ZINOF|nr:hypothetical protein ZIOFF_023859 [Zingiber officinale]